MKLTRRIAIHFLYRLALLFVIGIAIQGYLLFTVYQWSDSKNVLSFSYQDPKIFVQEIGQEVFVQKNQVVVDKKIMEGVAKTQGWLQILDEQGKELYQYNKPTSLPSQYTLSMLADEQYAEYKLYTWFTQKADQMITVVLGKPQYKEHILQLIQ